MGYRRPLASVRADVTVLGGGGPLPVDEHGNVYAATHIDIVAHEPIEGLSVTTFELTDAAGALIATGAPSAQLTRVAANGAVLGPFGGDIAPGTSVRLWLSVRLDARLDALVRDPPARFRTGLDSAGGALVVAGDVAAGLVGSA
jgi:hypothetical protein